MQLISNAEPDKNRLYGCQCARQFVWHLFNDHCKQAIEVAEKYSNKQATKKELIDAHNLAHRDFCESYKEYPLGTPEYYSNHRNLVIIAIACNISDPIDSIGMAVDNIINVHSHYDVAVCEHLIKMFHKFFQ